MAHIKPSTQFRIIKSCGDNGSSKDIKVWHHYDPATGGYKQTDADLGENAVAHTFLVEPFTFYMTRAAAEKRAKQLSKETPGNRYYVVETVSGFISRKPKTYKRSYR